MYRCRALPRPSSVPRLFRIQPSLSNRRDAGYTANVDAGDGQAVRRVLRKDTGRVREKDIPPQELRAILPGAQHEGAAKQEVFLCVNFGGDYQKLPNASEKHEASRN